MDAIFSVMYQSSTLLGTFIFVGVLAYLGTAAISPGNVALRRFVGYCSGTLMVIVGVVSLYFGGERLLTLLFAQLYTSLDFYHVEWTFLGIVAIIVGLLMVRQAYRRM
ncbi:MAG: hypothetical protein KGO05_00480 [Chloroflexota bacterium]|nr:hypothetical protein [Chloroflexota bacterium]